MFKEHRKSLVNPASTKIYPALCNSTRKNFSTKELKQNKEFIKKFVNKQNKINKLVSKTFKKMKKEVEMKQKKAIIKNMTNINEAKESQIWKTLETNYALNIDTNRTAPKPSDSILPPSSKTSSPISKLLHQDSESKSTPINPHKHPTAIKSLAITHLSTPKIPLTNDIIRRSHYIPPLNPQNSNLPTQPGSLCCHLSLKKPPSTIPPTPSPYSQISKISPKNPSCTSKRRQVLLSKECDSQGNVEKRFPFKIPYSFTKRSGDLEIV